MKTVTIHPFDSDPSRCAKVDNYLFDYVMPTVKPNTWKVLCLITKELSESATNLTKPLSLDFIKDNTGILSHKTVSDAIKELVFYEYISATRHKPDSHEIAAKVMTKTPQSIDDKGAPHCEWCKGKTFRLISHHFPIPAKDNGEETVNICANCHDEYHYLADVITYVFKMEVGEFANHG